MNFFVNIFSAKHDIINTENKKQEEKILFFLVVSTTAFADDANSVFVVGFELTAETLCTVRRADATAKPATHGAIYTGDTITTVAEDESVISRTGTQTDICGICLCN